MSEIAIVYYSLDGNVDYIAKLLAQKTGAELIRLETARDYPKSGFMKFFIGGRDASLGIQPHLKTALPDLNQFSTIVIGTPVWAGKPSAPVNSFLHMIRFTGKRIALFACCGGGPTDKCFARMQPFLASNTIITSDTFISPLENKGETVKRKIDMIASKIC